MKRFAIVLLCWCSAPAMATHIVGGEFEFLFRGVDPVSGQYRYNLSLILYFDKVNGSIGARDASVNIRIFRKRDNAIMRSMITLTLKDFTAVGYYKPECSTGNSIQTDRIFYTYMVGGQQAEYLLPPDEFNDPMGYYMVWERCCRNYGITNIFSENPDSGSSLYAGQTFYLEFPALIRGGKPFYNSSPSLFPPLSDYACPNRHYWVRFNGQDADGDSLAYSLVTPLNTLTGDAVPPSGLPRPGPYPEVLWRPGFSNRNFMKGNPDLKIDRKGLLTVTPTVAGLYVFAVKCEEFRNGIKIGEIRRDFQMLVLTDCPPATKPVVEGKRKDQLTYNRNQLSVTFDNTITDENRCIDIRVSDPDAATRMEKIKILAVAVDFENDVSEILPASPTATLSHGNTASFTVCFPQCPYKLGKYTIDIIVEDDACPLPLMDTLTVEVDIELPPNALPEFDFEQITETRQEGGLSIPVWTFTGTDGDLDELEVFRLNEEDFDLEEYGFTYTTLENEAGKIVSQLTWNSKCDEVPAFQFKTDFELKFELNDKDKCDLTPSDTITFNLTMDLVDIHSPQITYLPLSGAKEITITKKIYETISFQVKGSDEDAEDEVVLRGKGLDFQMNDYNASFPEKIFKKEGQSPFNWFLDCNQIDLNDKNEFEFLFEVVDSKNRCNYYLADTLHVTVKVEPPGNQIPHLTVNGNSTDFDLAYTLGEKIEIPAFAVDADINPTDLLSMELINAQGSVEPEGYTFTSTPQQGNVTGTFAWQPECNIFIDQLYENHYSFTFRVYDARCNNIGADTIQVNIKIKDIENAPGEFMPPNIITPNGDGKNEFFAMLKEDETTRELVNILPKDNCAGHFVRIVIYNRWGREVFESVDREFKWYANNDPSGMYYYQLIFSDKEYKGIITVASGG